MSQSLGWSGTLLPKLQDANDTAEVGKALIDVLSKLNQLASNFDFRVLGQPTTLPEIVGTLSNSGSVVMSCAPTIANPTIANPTITGSLTVDGAGSFITPGAGTTGGVIIRDASGDPGEAILQFTNNADSIQYGYFQAGPATVGLMSASLGIGTVTPGCPLDVYGAGSFITPGVGSTGGVRIRDVSGDPGTAILQFLNNAGNSELVHISGSSGMVAASGTVSVPSGSYFSGGARHASAAGVLSTPTQAAVFSAFAPYFKNVGDIIVISASFMEQSTTYALRFSSLNYAYLAAATQITFSGTYWNFNGSSTYANANFHIGTISFVADSGSGSLFSNQGSPAGSYLTYSL